jgi:hypothetical protein
LLVANPDRWCRAMTRRSGGASKSPFLDKTSGLLPNRRLEDTTRNMMRFNQL